MERNYKAIDPEKTIENIQGIINELGIITKELSINNPFIELYSLRLEAFHNDYSKGIWGTNGKGRTIAYAKASAYAEFMERLQNLLIPEFSYPKLQLESIYEKFGFYYYPDEKSLDLSDFEKIPHEILDIIFGENNENNIKKYVKRRCDQSNKGIVAVPFLNITTDKVDYLPYNLLIRLTGSNGMCAGNTQSEALYQGLYEIIERFCSSEIFFNRLTPPTITEDYLKEFKSEYEIIQKIRMSGFKVIIKSFQTKYNFPVLGLLLIDPKKNKYRLNIGADSSFRIALSRCLTEVFQGIRDEKNMQKIMIDIPYKPLEYFESNDYLSVCRQRHEFDKYTQNGTGQFPIELFYNESSYDFNPGCFEVKKSFDEECKSIICKISNLGFSIYIRNVSFTGFNSYWIFIPEMSTLGNYKNNLYPINSIDKIIINDIIEDLLFAIRNGKRRDIESLIRLLTRHKKELNMGDIYKIETTDECDWCKIPVSYLISILHLSVNDRTKATEYFGQFVDSIGQEYSKNLKKLEDMIFSYDRSINYNLQNEIQHNFFDFVRLPNCPNCEQCDIIHECITRMKIELHMNIASKMSNYNIHQCFDFLKN